METKSTGQKILHFPLTKIIIGVLVVAGIVVIGESGIEKILNHILTDKEIRNLITGIFVALLAFFSYKILFRFYEKREITELSAKGSGRNLISGILLGAILQSLTIFVIYLNGGLSIISINPLLFLIPPLAMALTSGIFEEILLRGIIFRIMQEKLGSYIALVISALIFGALHLANPNSSLITALGISIEAGLLLGAAYIYSGSLWFPIAIHFAWNFTQSGIFGATVSGITLDKTLLTTKIQGSVWITGGLFGPEGSIQTPIFCLVPTIILLILCHKQNKIIKPYWIK